MNNNNNFLHLVVTSFIGFVVWAILVVLTIWLIAKYIEWRELRKNAPTKVLEDLVIGMVAGIDNKPAGLSFPDHAVMPKKDASFESIGRCGTGSNSYDDQLYGD